MKGEPGSSGLPGLMGPKVKGSSKVWLMDGYLALQALQYNATMIIKYDQKLL